MNSYIKEAVEEFRKNIVRYRRPQQYYSGVQDLCFATEKFKNAFGSLFREFALNLCPAICDAVKDKLNITGFEATDGSAEMAKKANDLWHMNRMALRSGELHKEVLRSGDAYAIVWPDDKGVIRIYPNPATNMTVFYDEACPGKLVRAAKHWRSHDKHTRLNIYFPDRIERYISRRPNEGSIPDAEEMVPLQDRSAANAPEGHITENPYGAVPIFHFANNADVGMPGRSELESAIPIQDGLNKSVLDMLVAMEFSAFRQRWASGIDLELNDEGKPVSTFIAGIDHLWITQESGARFGDFDAAELEQFLKVKDSFRIDLACVTGTPLHYLMPHMTGQPSGESLKKAETRFLAKVRNRQASFGQIWAELMEFAVRAQNADGEIRLVTKWEDPSPISERERLEILLLKKRLGQSA